MDAFSALLIEEIKKQPAELTGLLDWPKVPRLTHDCQLPEWQQRCRSARCDLIGNPTVLPEPDRDWNFKALQICGGDRWWRRPGEKQWQHTRILGHQDFDIRRETIEGTCVRIDAIHEHPHRASKIT